MGEAADRLTGLASSDDRFNIPYAELRALQVEALNERFQENKGTIKLLSHRAREAGLSEVRSLDDAVQLLFPHTAYKSYPENWLLEERWDKLTKWLSTISAHPIRPIDMEGIADVDDWIDRLQAAGHFISCSSGTTGKSAMLIASQKDMDWSKTDTVNVFSWGSGVQPRRDRKIMGLAPVAKVPKNEVIGEAQREAFGDPTKEPFHYPVPAITVGSLTRMVVLRKAIADGTARPGDIAEFEQTSRERQEAMDRAVDIAADEMIAHRHDKLYIAGMWNALYQVARAVRERGYSAKDFDPDNCIYIGGGLKRAQLPEDYQQFVHETFNIPEGRHFQNYSMQELNSGMPKCREGNRYHVPSWIVPMILNKDGDALLAHDYDGEVEGRAAFFDLSLDGRWGGVITGDRISLDYGPCACGNAGPSIRDNIARYADLEGDDKIGCAGTVDAYVRGVA
ncbi:hypothetical protein [Sphingomonas cavernae]|uniref:Acyl-protein synthetase LuxE domain-containing protein n=1 Tax=Sphingomonas cavernae TaxID=2320861 RepID=A0A418WNN2_9SPHN|nr:hypothetical protein [Sphingomonas cavernae]RJF91599.1 hypothetical protein D3876_13935 [Sphingomonas cavernae]